MLCFVCDGTNGGFIFSLISNRFDFLLGMELEKDKLTKNEFYKRIKSVISKRLVRPESRDPMIKSFRFFTIEKRISPKGVTINDMSNIVTISFERKKLSL